MIEVETRGPARVVRLCRPEVRNALTPQVLDALRRALEGADVDDGIVAVVLTGEDPAFCAGLDLQVLADDPASFAGWDLPGWFEAIRKPVIAAVNGPAITGGMELALQADIRVASERARFADTHATVGVVPGWGMTVQLPELVGTSRAIELSLTGRTVGADEALRIGLVDQVVAHGLLLPTAVALVERMAKGDAATRRAVHDLYRARRHERSATAQADERRRSDAWLAALDASGA